MDIETITDFRYIKRFQNGDSSAFSFLYQKYWGLAFTVALSITHNEEEAKDVAQNVFLSICDDPNAIVPAFGIKRFLVVCVKNASINAVKIRKDLQDEDEEKNPSDDDVESDFRYHELIETIAVSLGETDFQIFYLHAVYEYKFKEIGQMLSLSLDAVTSKYTRAINKIRTLPLVKVYSIQTEQEKKIIAKEEPHGNQ